jgi:hypothetical protein
MLPRTAEPPLVARAPEATVPVPARGRLDPAAPLPVPPGSSPGLLAPAPAGTQPPPAAEPSDTVSSAGEPSAIRAASEVAESSPLPPAAPIDTGRLEEQRIRAILGEYRSAYERLDASAAKAVWPSVDQRALARAFEGLRSQGLAFDDCQMQVRGQQATATCRGRATFVPRVGSSGERTERRQWTFELQKVGESWLIRSALAR